MGTDLYLPPKTAAELNSHHPAGTRHQAMIKIALSLIGNNFSDQAIFAELRSKFPDQDKTDKEIRDVIQWCHDVPNKPQPSGFGAHRKTEPVRYERRAEKVEPGNPSKMVAWYLNGRPSELRRAGGVTIEGLEPVLVFAALYLPTDRINIVCAHTVNAKGKANPSGGGKTLLRDDWIDWFQTKGAPQSEAGAWVRMNPCVAKGTGKGGAIMDADTTAYRFLLLESDVLNMDEHLALYSVLKLPIAAVIASGGAKSVHAWVKLDATTDEAYTVEAARILKALEPFGFDQSNKNPSRLSRLPGSTRKIGGAGDGHQRLLYLNPTPGVWDETAAKRFEDSLLRPLPDPKPMKRLIQNSRVRYEELHTNRGKLGVQVGLHEMDRDTGGFKKGQMTVLAAGTNGGKTTCALNFLNGALIRNHKVVLFTLEMDHEEIVDLLVAMNLTVNRNVFNTGYFGEDDIRKVTIDSKCLEELPLWIFDDATMTVKGMEENLRAVMAETEVGFVVVDYVQIVQAADDHMSREQQVANIARDLRILCRSTRIPFLVLSQLNDDGKLRESRVVAHEANNVMLLEVDGRKAKLRVVKGRGIPKKTYEMDYAPEHCWMTSPVMETPTYEK